MLQPHKNLIAYYPSGRMTVDHSVVNGNALTVTGSIRQDGVYGAKQYFDGVDDVLYGTTTQNIAAMPLYPKSFAMWVSSNYTTSTGYQFAIRLGDTTAAFKCIMLRFNAGKFGISCGNGNLVLTSPPVNVVNHVCLSFFGNEQLRVWYNGYEKGGISLDPNDCRITSLTNTIELGGATVANNYGLSGTLEEVSIWNISFTNEIVRSLMAGVDPVI